MGTPEPSQDLDSDDIPAVMELLLQRRRDRTDLQERMRRAANAEELRAYRHWIGKVQDEIDQAANYLSKRGIRL